MCELVNYSNNVCTYQRINTRTHNESRSNGSVKHITYNHYAYCRYYQSVRVHIQSHTETDIHTRRGRHVDRQTDTHMHAYRRTDSQQKDRWTDTQTRNIQLYIYTHTCTHAHIRRFMYSYTYTSIHIYYTCMHT